MKVKGVKGHSKAIKTFAALYQGSFRTFSCTFFKFLIFANLLTELRDGSLLVEIANKNQSLLIKHRHLASFHSCHWGEGF